MLCDTPDALRDKIKKKKLIYLVVEEITPAQIERCVLLQGVIRHNGKNSEDNYAQPKGIAC